MNSTDPINELSGVSTESGWIIGDLVKRRPEQTGGFHSVGYEAHHPDLGKGFIKAIDFSKAMESENISDALQRLTMEYNFERNLANRLTERAGRRVVRCLDHGAVEKDGVVGGKVLYLIFERADGDLRTQVVDGALTFAERLELLHCIFLCIAELHKNSVSHQDLKPSNFLTFLLQETTKVGDFGRSWSADDKSPFDGLAMPCQAIHAPIDRMYRRGEVIDETDRYLGDLYGLGAMACWLLADLPFTPSFVHLLNTNHKPRDFDVVNGWKGYFADVLPYLVSAHSTLISDLEGTICARWPEKYHVIIGHLIEDIDSLTHPDPTLRGNLKARLAKARSNADLQPYISRMDRWLAMARIAARG